MIRIFAERCFPFCALAENPMEYFREPIRNDIKMQIIKEMIERAPIMITEEEREIRKPDGSISVEYVVRGEIIIPEAGDLDRFFN